MNKSLFLCLCFLLGSMSWGQSDEDVFKSVMRKKRRSPRKQRQPSVEIKNPHMFEGGSSSAITISNIKSQENQTQQISGFLGYYYQGWESLQIGADVYFVKTDTITTYSILPGVVLNLFYDKGITNAFYVKGNIGVAGATYSSSDLENTSEMLLYGEIGKRFELAENITWSPSLSTNYYPDVEDYDPTLSINLLKFNLFF